MKAIYKSVALLFGAMSLFSSCEDFLTRDPQDSYLLEDFLNSDDKLSDYTKQVCGPLTWNGFDDKFSWCVGELYSGNVYHNFADEGQFHFMSFTANNAHISNGYTSLYSVIAKCNHIINDIPEIAKKNGLSETVLNTAIGEAKMYRGMAYFFLAEYWGASPIILHNSETVSKDLAPQVTKADRKSLYTLIEKDWKEAVDLLPTQPRENNRVWKASALGMLTKLYVTMASCQANLDEPGSYKCDNPDEYYEKAKSYGDETINLCKENGVDLTPKEGYDQMFQPGSQNPEILFALLFEQGVYAQGCSRQIQFARSKHLAAGGNAYGGEKGLTTNLFNSYEKGDVRLDATSYYIGTFDVNHTDRMTLEEIEKGTAHSYSLIDAPDGKNTYYYFLNPNKSLKQKERDQYFGNEPNSAIFNHCRKFVYSVKPANSEFSINLTFPLLRLADVYLLVAEAQMGLESKSVENPTSSGDSYINYVRKRAGLKDTTKVAFCMPDIFAGNADVATATVQDPDGNDVDITASCDMYKSTYDLMLERRHEFALENQAWLDIKRLYYRNPEAAKKYIESQDRAYVYGEKFGLEGSPTKMSDFQRQRLIHDLSVRANQINPAYAEQASEGVIELDKLQFFLPVPASVAKTANFNTINDYSEQILNGQYQY